MSNLRRPSAGEVIAVCVVVALVAAIIYPVFSRSRDKIARITCASNEKSLGNAILAYAQDNANTLPAGAQGEAAGWGGKIYSYIKCVGVYRCPDDLTPIAGADPVVSYAINAATAQYPALTRYPAPSHTVLLFEVTGVKADIMRPDEGASRGATVFSASGDGTGGTLSAGHAAPKYATGDLGHRPDAASAQFADPRHDGGSNVLFADGHMKWFRPEQVSGSGNAVRPADGQTGTIHGTAAGTQDSAFAATFSVK